MVPGVGLNPTRTGFFEVLSEMGAHLVAEVEQTVIGEPTGRLRVEPGPLVPFEFGDEIVPRLVDEIPALVVLASRVDGVSSVTGAGELRVKESNRLSLLSHNLRDLGVECEEKPDGLRVRGTSAPLEGRVRTGGDHRIAMAFAALNLSPGCRIEIDEPGCVDVSFPGFWEALDALAPEGEPA